MTRIVITGLWICAITVLSSFAVITWMPALPKPRAEEYLEGLTYQKLRPINIPIIAEGSVQGYVIATIIFTAEAHLIKGHGLTPAPFVMDESFRQIYGDGDLDFRNLKKYDINKRLDDIKRRVNERLGSEVVKDVMIENFNFVTKKDIRS
ncbi:hypothetical protein [Methylobacterium longum]|uniref:Flagellar basal body-associated protein FliL n=1 Tax=Methylobacterium longum TaxID=767694 RepID=A0ABT8AQL5_9HYPH|nr:hypothetical protein [Methylobacterium longum]MDN3571664.1 hypothetical protein [Methylobacterium longum]GJE11672.1 hypothetical protein FOHLNKBM_2716 [Methylobacterium longum]